MLESLTFRRAKPPKEYEVEKDRMKKALADFKKKAERAERMQRRAEVMTAEMRGKLEAEKEVCCPFYCFSRGGRSVSPPF